MWPSRFPYYIDNKSIPMNIKELDLMVSNYGTARQGNYDLVVLPWGATEPHNLHLPYLTDAILSHDTAVEAARKALDLYGVRVMVLPWIAAGAQNPGQRDLRFCIHYSHATQAAILADTVASLAQQGFDKLLIVNGHGGNTFKPMIRDLAVAYPDFRIAACEWFKLAPAKDFFDDPGDHADELETSVMMHYHPELVNLADAGTGAAGGFKSELLNRGLAWLPRNWQRVSTDTGIGSPALATPEKGARFAEAVTDTMARLYADLCEADLYC